jgi:hypothetical protein
MSTRALRSVLFGVACVLASACGSKDALDASDDKEAIASSTQATHFDQVLYSGVSSSDPTEAASSTAASQWWPAGCVMRSRDATTPNIVHVRLDDCTGPFGLRHHTGDLTVVFTSNTDGSLHASATSANMTVNSHPVSYARDSDITIDVSGGTRTIHSTGTWTRVDDEGETVTHSSDLTTVVNIAEDTRTTNGTGQTSVGSRDISSTITNYTVRRGLAGEGCPSGTVTHERAATGDTVTITFDGTPEAEVTGPKGKSIEVPLVCGG